MRRAYLPALLILLVLAGSVSARTWYIKEDGSGDAPTIQAGIDSAVAGDTVVVAYGTYYEFAVQMKSGTSLISETGQADCVTIDAEWQSRVMQCVNCDLPTLIRGLTFTRGYPVMDVPPKYGGGLHCVESSSLTIENCAFLDNQAGCGAGMASEYSSPTISNCVFTENSMASYGGGLYCGSCPPMTVTNCVFAGNSSLGRGGGLLCWDSSPVIRNCTFFGNVAWGGGGGEMSGGGIYCLVAASPTIENTIISYSIVGEAVYCEPGSTPAFACCDIYGNAGGDWAGTIADQAIISGNFSADPLFCDTLGGDYRLETCSPCLPGNHPDGYDCAGVIGAFGEGCACGASTDPSTWGTIKAMYR